MSKRALIAAYFILLFFLHQDFWWKDEPALVLGFLPVSLAYHVVWTLLVALGWYCVGKFSWADKLDDDSRGVPGARPEFGVAKPPTSATPNGTSSRHAPSS